MKAIILSAGKGTRLRPYTDDRPKCMVSLAGRPLLHWQLDTLRSADISNITIVGGYLAGKLDAPETTLVVNEQYDVTNMVSTLFCAKSQMLPEEDLLICYGDIVYEDKVLESLLASDAEISLAADLDWHRLWSLRMDEPLSDAETFRMGSDCRVVELGKKPLGYEDVQAQYMGLIKVRSDCVTRFVEAYNSLDHSSLYDGKDFDNMYMTSFIQYLIDSSWDVKASLVNNGWLEVDTSEELECYEELYRTGKLTSVFRGFDE